MIIQSKNHRRLRLDPKVHSQEIVLAEVRPGLFEADVPHHVGQALLSVAKNDDDFKQVVEPTKPEEVEETAQESAQRRTEAHFRQVDSDQRARWKELGQRAVELDEREKGLDVREEAIKAREVAAVTPAPPPEHDPPASAEGLDSEGEDQAQPQQEEASDKAQPHEASSKGGHKGRR